jgi:hypothetical protein
MDSGTEQSRASRGPDAFAKALALDPYFVQVETGDRTRVRRTGSETGIKPWVTSIVWTRGQPGRAVISTDIEGVPESKLQVTVTAEDDVVGPRRILVEMTDGSVIPKSVFSRLRLSQVRSQIEHDLESPVIQHQLGFFNEEAWSDPFARLPRPGRRGRPDWQYLLWAARYVTALAENPRRPVALMAETYPGRSANTIRSYLNKARRRGLLTSARVNGLPGGELTKRGQRLLDEYRDALPTDDPLLREKK